MSCSPGSTARSTPGGQIVGRRESGYHIKFTALGTDDELAIARYIDEVGIGWD